MRVGPLLGLMGTLIPLAPALQALADGDTQKLADNLTVAFSVTVLGLLIGGIAFVISIMRDRFYSQDISDLEYLLELLEGNAEPLRVGKPRRRKGEFEDYDDDLWDEEDDYRLIGGRCRGGTPTADLVPTTPVHRRSRPCLRRRRRSRPRRRRCRGSSGTGGPGCATGRRGGSAPAGHGGGARARPRQPPQTRAARPNRAPA